MLTQTKAKIALQSKSGVATFECSPGERLLFAGLAQGLSLPYECATGTCGTCRGRVMEGNYETAWLEAPGAAKLKRERGDVLLCQTHPGSDCVVRVAANVAQITAGALPMRRSGRVEVARLLTPDVMHVEIELSVPMTPHWNPAMTAVIGLSASTHCHFIGICEIEYMTPEISGSTWRNTGTM